MKKFSENPKSKIDAISQEIAILENKHIRTQGSTARYVCASPKCMKKMLKKMPYTGGEIDIDSELAETIYTRVRAFAMLDNRPEKTNYFNTIFDEDILRNYLDYMILSDFVLSGRDRHLSNVSILRNAQTLQFVKPAPIYDSGKCLFVQDSVPSSDKGLLSIKTESFASDELKLLGLVSDRSLLDITKLPSRSFIEEIYRMDSQIDEKRISLIGEGYEFN